MKNLLSLPVAAALLSLLPAGPAHADHIEFADGGSVEGKLEEVKGAPDRLRLVLRVGWAEISRSRVAKTTPAPLPWEDYASKAAAVAPADLKGHLDLAAWCRQQGLFDEARAELEKALAADGECVQAREGLGWRRENGVWTREPEKPAEEAKDVTATVPAQEAGKEVPAEARRPVEGLFGPWRNDALPALPRSRASAPPEPLDYGAWWALYGPPRRTSFLSAWSWHGGWGIPSVACPQPCVPSIGLGLSGEFSLPIGSGGRIRVRLN